MLLALLLFFLTPLYNLQFSYTSSLNCFFSYFINQANHIFQEKTGTTTQFANKPLSMDLHDTFVYPKFRISTLYNSMIFGWNSRTNILHIKFNIVNTRFNFIFTFDISLLLFPFFLFGISDTYISQAGIPVLFYAGQNVK